MTAYMFNIFFTAAIALVFIIVTRYIQGAFANDPKKPKLPPGPTPWPLVGNIFQLLLNKPAFRWIHSVMKQLNTDIACFRFGTTHVITVTSEKIAQEFLRKQDAVFASRPTTMAQETFTRGYLSAVLTPNNDQWKKMKKVLTGEILTPTRHQLLQEKRSEEADNLIRYVYNRSQTSGIVDLRVVTRHYCGNIIRRLVFGKRYFGESMLDGGPGPVEEKHIDALFTALNSLFVFSVSDYFPWLIGFGLEGQEKIVKEARKVIDQFHNPEIEDRIHQWRNPTNGIEKMDPQDMLDILISLKNKNGEPLLNSEEVKAQITDITMAAVDNPSNAVEWIIGEMLKNPKILEKAVEEVDRVVGKERLVQEYDIPHLNYMKACIRESFRLHPVAPFNVPHVAMQDTTIAGYHIPKGSQVLLSRYGLGRNPNIWDNPLVFKPERHLINQSSEIVLTDPELQLISFSTGRRGCNGVLLGTTMSVMLLARLIQGFDWSLPPSVPKVDLVESETNLFLAKSLVAVAKPRLAPHLYKIK